MSFPKVKYQQITFSVSALNARVTIDAETDKLYNTCTGINIVLTDEGARFSKLQLDFNGQEVFPEFFEVLRLKFRDQAPFGYDFHRLNEPAGGSKIKGTYTDISGATAYPYSVTICLRLENTESTDAGKVD